MLTPYLKQLILNQALTREESYRAGRTILENALPAQTAAFLALLAAKGESVEELLGLIKAIKQSAINLSVDKPIVDIVGTGGDGASTINISTAAALLTAACEVPVVKHGNRAVSSQCGSADVLEKLGYSIDLTQEQVNDSLTKHNFAFCYAPNYYPLLAKVRHIRQELKIPTVFNLLGPLLNPAGIKHMVLGVYTQDKVELVAQTLFKLGTHCSIVFHGHGLDELSCLGTINAILVTATGLTTLQLNPLELGLKLCTLEDLRGGNALYNAEIISKALSGQPTLVSDTIILNTAVALFIYGKVTDVASGVIMAKQRLAAGNVIKKNRLHEILMRKSVPLIAKKSLKAAICSKPKGAVIAEIKRASPSAGKIALIDDPVARAKKYVASGAIAISVLTNKEFDGSFADLSAVCQALRTTNVPILCKDFIFTPQQIAQAALAGANAILLMVSVLHNETAQMVKIAHAFGLETLVEVHSPRELPIALAAGGDLIGINQRDLSDFTMHPEVFTNLIGQIPINMVKVAESGIKNAEDAKSAYKLGYDAVLVGEALSRLNNPSEFFANLYA